MVAKGLRAAATGQAAVAGRGQGADHRRKPSAGCPDCRCGGAPWHPAPSATRLVAQMEPTPVATLFIGKPADLVGLDLRRISADSGTEAVVHKL